jgi:hypothetical protein
VKNITIATALLSALLATTTSAHAETRCGWLQNGGTHGLDLFDRDGDWQIIGNNTAGNDAPPGFDQHMPATDEGRSCGCLTVDTNKATHRITRIYKGKLIPIQKCQADPSLKQWN